MYYAFISKKRHVLCISNMSDNFSMAMHPKHSRLFYASQSFWIDFIMLYTHILLKSVPDNRWNDHVFLKNTTEVVQLINQYEA